MLRPRPALRLGLVVLLLLASLSSRAVEPASQAPASTPPQATAPADEADEADEDAYQPITTRSSSLARFQDRFVEIQTRLRQFAGSRQEFAELYQAYRPELQRRLETFADTFWHSHTDFGLTASEEQQQQLARLTEQYHELQQYFQLRQHILSAAPPDYAASFATLKSKGIDEARMEFHFIALQVMAISKAFMDRALEMPLRVFTTPLDLVLNAFYVIVALVVLFAWRSWARKGLLALRQRLFSTGQRTRLRVHLARLIWYFDHTRAPLEYYLLFAFMLHHLDILELPLINQLLLTLVYWVSLAFFLLLLLNKLIERGRQDLLRGITNRQALSIKLLVWLLIGYLLSAELVAPFISYGTLLIWLQQLSLLLLLPFYAYFIYQWRDNVFAFIAEERDAAPWAKAMVQPTSGLKGLLFTNLSFFYALYFVVSKSVLQLFTRFESGRRLATELYRHRLEADNNAFIDSLKAPQFLAPEAQQAFLERRDHYDPAICAEALAIIQQKIVLQDNSPLALIGERGIGKTALLTQLHQQTPNSLYLNCLADFEQLLQRFAHELELEESTEVKADTLDRALRERSIGLLLLDNCHHLVSPMPGGQRNLKRLYGLINDLKGHVLCVMSFELYAWQLIKALNIATGFFSRELSLGAWGEAQIGQLLQARTEQQQWPVRYDHLYMPRQIVDVEEQTLEERNKSGVYRIIWGYAGGNPAVALRSFAQAIVWDGPECYASLPVAPSMRLIESLDIHTLLVLRVICQFGRVMTNEIVSNLRMHGLVVNSSLATLTAQGLIEQTEAGYQISWQWYRPVTRYLSRQNLLTG